MPVFLDQFELVLLFTWKSTNTSYWTTYNWNENWNKIRQQKTHNKISISCEGYEYGRPLSTLVSHKPNSAKDSVQSLVVLNICKYNYGLTVTMLSPCSGVWSLGSAFNSYLFKWTIKYCPDDAILFSREVNKWNCMIFCDFPKIQWLFSYTYDRKANFMTF